MRADKTSGRKKQLVNGQKEDLLDKLGELRIPETILPKFSICSVDVGSRVILSVVEGTVGYDNWLLRDINFSLTSQERTALVGDNGSGKTTILKEIPGDPLVKGSGEWVVPKPQDIGYLDQHYRTLDPGQTVLETIQDVQSSWSYVEIRRHLNDFLFRKNEEVMARTTILSGGEKAWLSLAQIVPKTPKLLMLDEVTNNVDFETRDHIIRVLKEHPGTLLVISHDSDFLKEIGVEGVYNI